ncbi:MAG: hypothetical protein AAF517_05830 [Planctomycetota bacterium]
MSQRARTRIRRRWWAVLWLVGIVATGMGAWLLKFRYEESKLLAELEAAVGVETPNYEDWAPIADRLIALGSKRSVPQILESSFRTKFDVTDGLGYPPVVERLCETFGSHYVWRHSFEFLESYGVTRNGYFNVGVDRFWVQDPESTEFAAFIERLARSEHKERRVLATTWIPLSVAMPRDRKLNLLFEFLRDRRYRWPQIALKAISFVGAPEREAELFEVLTIVHRRMATKDVTPDFLRTLTQVEGGPLRFFLWVNGSRLTDVGLPQNLEFVGNLRRRIAEDDGWLERVVRSPPKAVGSELTSLALAEFARRGWVSEERLLEFFDRANWQHRPKIDWATVFREVSGESARARMVERLYLDGMIDTYVRVSGRKGPEELLRAWGEDRTELWRRCALLALGPMRSKSSEVRETIVKSLESHDVGGAAVFAVQWLESKPPLARRLIELLTDESKPGGLAEPPEVRYSAVDWYRWMESLIGLESAPDVPWLIAALDRPHAISELAVRMLGCIGSAASEAVPYLRRRIDSAATDSVVRFLCARSLARITKSLLDKERALSFARDLLHQDDESAAWFSANANARDWLEQCERLRGTQVPCAVPDDLLEAVRADPTLAAKLPEEISWLRTWLFGTPAKRSATVAFLQRQLSIPRIHYSMFVGPFDHREMSFQVAVQSPKLAKRLRPVWRQWAASHQFDSYIEGHYALWVAGEPLDVESLRKAKDYRNLSGRNFLWLVQRVGRDAAVFRDDVVRIWEETTDLYTLREAQRALDAIDGKGRKR